MGQTECESRAGEINGDGKARVECAEDGRILVISLPVISLPGISLPSASLLLTSEKAVFCKNFTDKDLPLRKPNN